MKPLDENPNPKGVRGLWMKIPGVHGPLDWLPFLRIMTSHLRDTVKSTGKEPSWLLLIDSLHPLFHLLFLAVQM